MSKRARTKTQTFSQAYQKLEPKRYLASVGWDGAGQGSAELTYYLGDAPAEVGQETFESVIEQALEVWSDVADVTFTQTDVPNQTDSLDITFSSIDGAGGILAQAYLPDDVNRSRVAGDIEFDSSENWEVGNDRGFAATDLLYVAVHEIGHSLGLDHSHAVGSVLNDTVSPNQFFTGLVDADKDAALALYAPAVPVVPTTPIDEPVDPIDEPVAPVDITPVDGTTDIDNETTDSEVEVPTDSDTVDEDEGEETPEETERDRRRNFRNWLNRFFQRRRQFFNYFANFFGEDFGSSEVSSEDTGNHRRRHRHWRF